MAGLSILLVHYSACISMLYRIYHNDRLLIEYIVYVKPYIGHIPECSVSLCCINTVVLLILSIILNGPLNSKNTFLIFWYGPDNYGWVCILLPIEYFMMQWPASLRYSRCLDRCRIRFFFITSNSVSRVDDSVWSGKSMVFQLNVENV